MFSFCESVWCVRHEVDSKELPYSKRWTIVARTGVVHDYIDNEVEEDSKLQSTERYRRLCQMLIRLANKASVHQSTFSWWKKQSMIYTKR